MIAGYTRAAILALLAVDAGATDAEKERVTEALGGIKPYGYVRIADAANKLGVHRNTIHRMIKSGKLKPVMGAYGHRALGVTEDSLARL